MLFSPPSILIIFVPRVIYYGRLRGIGCDTLPWICLTHVNTTHNTSSLGYCNRKKQNLTCPTLTLNLLYIISLTCLPTCLLPCLLTFLLLFLFMLPPTYLFIDLSIYLSVLSIYSYMYQSSWRFVRSGP